MNAAFDLRADRALTLVIDIQERFTAAIDAITEDGACAGALRALIQGSGHLQVPVVFSEQVPDKLGATLPYLRAAAADAPVHDKRHFSVVDDSDLRDHLADYDRPQVIICGIEAHICVLATAADLLSRGYQVIVASDAIASRNPAHRADAIASLRQLGALCLPVESILFRLQRIAEGDAFRALSRLVK
ncbi:MAG: isochorismatase family protein [Planctomycetota bacterium]|jgi:nicotinamidase-related amidase